MGTEIEKNRAGEKNDEIAEKGRMILRMRMLKRIGMRPSNLTFPQELLLLGYVQTARPTPGVKELSELSLFLEDWEQKACQVLVMDNPYLTFRKLWGSLQLRGKNYY